MILSFTLATAADALEIARLRTATARHLADQHGQRSFKGAVSEAGVLAGMRTARVLLAHCEGKLVAMLNLARKRPWAIDPTHFTKVARPLYLTNLSVAPEFQGRGVGRRILDAARVVARKWPGDAIRLDAQDDATGAGGFYEKCGYREVGRVTYRRTALIYYEVVL
jgi:ribosomal protein S18 acetylase RimI-like enzyme